jgi:hypothetical protein
MKRDIPYLVETLNNTICIFLAVRQKAKMAGLLQYLNTPP